MSKFGSTSKRKLISYNPFSELTKYRIETISHLWEGYFRYQIGQYFVFSMDLQGYQEFMFKSDELEYAFIHEFDNSSDTFIPLFLLEKNAR